MNTYRRIFGCVILCLLILGAGMARGETKGECLSRYSMHQQLRGNQAAAIIPSEMFHVAEKWCAENPPIKIKRTYNAYTRLNNGDGFFPEDCEVLKDDEASLNLQSFREYCKRIGKPLPEVENPPKKEEPEGCGRPFFEHGRWFQRCNNGTFRVEDPYKKDCRWEVKWASPDNINSPDLEGFEPFAVGKHPLHEYNNHSVIWLRREVCE